MFLVGLFLAVWLVAPIAFSQENPCVAGECTVPFFGVVDKDFFFELGSELDFNDEVGQRNLQELFEKVEEGFGAAEGVALTFEDATAFSPESLSTGPNTFLQLDFFNIIASTPDLDISTLITPPQELENSINQYEFDPAVLEDSSYSFPSQSLDAIDTLLKQELGAILEGTGVKVDDRLAVLPLEGLFEYRGDELQPQELLGDEAALTLFPYVAQYLGEDNPEARLEIVGDAEVYAKEALTFVPQDQLAVSNHTIRLFPEGPAGVANLRSINTPDGPLRLQRTVKPFLETLEGTVPICSSGVVFGRVKFAGESLDDVRVRDISETLEEHLNIQPFMGTKIHFDIYPQRSWATGQPDVEVVDQQPRGFVGQDATGLVTVAVLDTAGRGLDEAGGNIEIVDLHEALGKNVDPYPGGHGFPIAKLVRKHIPDAPVKLVQVCGEDGECNLRDVVLGMCQLLEGQVSQAVGGEIPTKDTIENALKHLVVNMSFGYIAKDDETPILKSLLEQMARQHVGLVASAGQYRYDRAHGTCQDGMSGNVYPAAYDISGFVVVGGVTQSQPPAAFCPLKNQTYVDVWASAQLEPINIGMPAGKPWVGTSFAAPRVSATMARIKAEDATAKIGDIEEALKSCIVGQSGSPRTVSSATPSQRQSLVCSYTSRD